MTTYIDFPCHITPQGRTATTNHADHVRDLIESVLFTDPGERVNRPTFGAGAGRLLFAPASDELATATQFLVQGNLQQWLGDIIHLEEVRVVLDDSTLTVTVRYVLRRTQERVSATFQREQTA